MQFGRHCNPKLLHFIDVKQFISMCVLWDLNPWPRCQFFFLSEYTELVMLLEWWSDTECTLYTDQATVDKFGKEHVIIILNHNFEIDFLCGWTICERYGVLGVSYEWLICRFGFVILSSIAFFTRSLCRAQRFWLNMNCWKCLWLAGRGTSWKSSSAKGAGMRTGKPSSVD